MSLWNLLQLTAAAIITAVINRIRLILINPAGIKSYIPAGFIILSLQTINFIELCGKEAVYNVKWGMNSVWLELFIRAEELISHYEVNE